MPTNLILGPRARRAILARTYLDPAHEYHVRELVRRTGLAPRTVHQEVEKLVRAGLLAERRDGNRRYLHANERHPLFRPIREIVLKTDGLADVLRDALGTDGIGLALVFGSIAAATPQAGSDVDLLVVGEIGLREAVRRLRGAQDVLGREIVPNVWTRAEFDRRRGTGDHFLDRVLDGPMIPVVGSLPGQLG
jgi:DNA-binding transcriptional ArsR family regulator